MVGSQPNTDGMVLEASFADGSKEEVRQGWHSLYDTSKPGEAQVLIYYGAVKVQYTVTVLAEGNTGNGQGEKDPSPSVDTVINDNLAETSPLHNEEETSAQDNVDANQETIPQIHTHHFGTQWHYDEIGHWLECSCGAKGDRTEHLFEAESDTQGRCAVCGYKCGESSETQEPPEEIANANKIYIIPVAVMLTIGCFVAIGIVIIKKKERKTTIKSEK